MAVSAITPRDWKIALMQRVLFGFECSSLKRDFSESVMMGRVQKIADIAKELRKWPEIIPDKKRYEEEVLARVQKLLNEFEEYQGAYTRTLKRIDQIEQNSKVSIDHERLNELRRARFSWEKVIFGFSEEKMIDPKGKLEREIALLKKWQKLLTATPRTEGKS
ncbi:MAG TPA: hypothetical protein VLF94_01545 [Chlamydiales bacterium]|nr:hypothetical protein [Chlamydiales bacterium]